jgi:hypothetical protein
VNCILDLSDGVFIWSSNENGDRLRILAVLNERKFVLSLKQGETAGKTLPSGLAASQSA